MVRTILSSILRRSSNHAPALPLPFVFVFVFVFFVHCYDSPADAGSFRVFFEKRKKKEKIVQERWEEVRIES